MTRSETLIDETYRFEKGEYWKPILNYGRSLRGTYMVSNYGNIIHWDEGSHSYECEMRRRWSR